MIEDFESGLSHDRRRSLNCEDLGGARDLYYFLMSLASCYKDGVITCNRDEDSITQVTVVKCTTLKGC